MTDKTQISRPVAATGESPVSRVRRCADDHHCVLSLMNFVNALERIPSIIVQYEERTANLKADVPILQSIIAKQWCKEDELKQLERDLATLDRIIAQSL